MVILVIFNSFNVVQNLKKPDPVARQETPFKQNVIGSYLMRHGLQKRGPILIRLSEFENSYAR